MSQLSNSSVNDTTLIKRRQQLLLLSWGQSPDYCLSFYQQLEEMGCALYIKRYGSTIFHIKLWLIHISITLWALKDTFYSPVLTVSRCLSEVLGSLMGLSSRLFSKYHFSFSTSLKRNLCLPKYTLSKYSNHCQQFGSVSQMLMGKHKVIFPEIP